jgi:hypothetical protein
MLLAIACCCFFLLFGSYFAFSLPTISRNLKTKSKSGHILSESHIRHNFTNKKLTQDSQCHVPLTLSKWEEGASLPFVVKEAWDTCSSLIYISFRAPGNNNYFRKKAQIIFVNPIRYQSNIHTSLTVKKLGGKLLVLSTNHAINYLYIRIYLINLCP